MWLYCQDIEEFDFIVKSSRNGCGLIVCGFIARTSRNLTLLSSHRGMWLDCMWLYCQDIEEFDFIVKSSRNVA